MPVTVQPNTVSAALAKATLDREEGRISAEIGELEEKIREKRQQLDEVQIARRVMERIRTQSATPPAGDTQDSSEQTDTATDNDSADEPEEKPAKPGNLTIKEAILRALEAVYPKGYQKSGIEWWIQKNLNQTINSASLSVMLARVRDREGAIRNNGNIWIFVPEKDRNAA